MTGAELRDERVAAGLSLYEIPRRMPVSVLRWHAIELGLLVPTAAELAEFELHVKRQPPSASMSAAWESTDTSPTSEASPRR